MRLEMRAAAELQSTARPTPVGPGDTSWMKTAAVSGVAKNLEARRSAVRTAMRAQRRLQGGVPGWDAKFRTGRRTQSRGLPWTGNRARKSARRGQTSCTSGGPVRVKRQVPLPFHVVGDENEPVAHDLLPPEIAVTENCGSESQFQSPPTVSVWKSLSSFNWTKNP